MAKYPANRIAMTTLYTGPRRAKGRAEIVEADIELNAVDFRLVGGPGGHEARGPMSVSLTAVLVHELGHVLGLGHNCAATSKEEGNRDHRGRKIPRCSEAGARERESIMFPIESLALRPIAGRLSRDDRDGLCALYPSRASSVMWTKEEKP